MCLKDLQKSSLRQKVTKGLNLCKVPFLVGLEPIKLICFSTNRQGMKEVKMVNDKILDLFFFKFKLRGPIGSKGFLKLLYIVPLIS